MSHIMLAWWPLFGNMYVGRFSCISPNWGPDEIAIWGFPTG
jgi:hypothetical protein